MREHFMQTERLRFGLWTKDDLPLARTLWGDPAVTRYISAAGVFSEEQIAARLALEVFNGEAYGVQYWPLFERESGELAGCCGLRPHVIYGFELGVHLRPAFWGKGLAREACRAVIDHAFGELGAQTLFAGHNPRNERSRALLTSLGFVPIGEEYYAPTGLLHPSYVLPRA